MTSLTLALISSQVVILGIAVIAETIQERAIRRRLSPADPAAVARFLASRSAAA